MPNESKSATRAVRGFGPGRSMLKTAVKARGRGVHNLWYHYSARLKADVILKSDVEFAHFCWVEADPTVLRYELEPAPVTVVVSQQALRTRFDAFVEFRDAPPELREIKTSEANLSQSEELQKVAQEAAAVKAGFRYVRITKADLAAHAQLIQNWRCALAYQAACRSAFLSPFEDELQSIVNQQQECTLDELLEETNPDLRATYLAALFGMLQQAKLHSDLDSKPLCAASRIWAREMAHA